MSGRLRIPCVLIALSVLAPFAAKSEAGDSTSGSLGSGSDRDEKSLRARQDGQSTTRPQAEADRAKPGSARDPAKAVNIAVVQPGSSRYFSASNPGPEANFTLVANLARQAAAAQPRPDVICFPEYAISGSPYPPEEQINSLAEAIPGDGPWYRRYRDLARQIGVPILGSLVESAEGKKYSTAFVIDGQGTFRGKYRKVHANLGEQTWWGWSQGTRFELIELNGVRYGVSICADMWFPETVRCEELLGADVILHQSIADDMGHIVPTRAIDSKMPIVMAIFQGGSYAVDAEGKLLEKLSSDPGWGTFKVFPFRRHVGYKYGGLWDMKEGDHNLRNVWAYSILTDPSTRPPWTDVFLDDEGRPQTREKVLKRFGGRYDAHDPASGNPTAPLAGNEGAGGRRSFTSRVLTCVSVLRDMMPWQPVRPPTSSLAMIAAIPRKKTLSGSRLSDQCALHSPSTDAMRAR